MPSERFDDIGGCFEALVQELRRVEELERQKQLLTRTRAVMGEADCFIQEYLALYEAPIKVQDPVQIAKQFLADLIRSENLSVPSRFLG